MRDVTQLEERIAHLTRQVDDLSDMVAREGKELDKLARLVDLLVKREAQRDADGSGGVIIGDERPPHY
jgi:SlyX protein